MGLVTELTALLQVRGRPDVPHHVVVVFEARPLLPEALGAAGPVGARGGGAGETPRVVDGVDRPVGVRHQVTGDTQLRVPPLGEKAVVLGETGVSVTEGAAVRLTVAPSRAVLQRVLPNTVPDQGDVVLVEAPLQ